MTKLYVRCCDFCKKEIKKLYDYGVTTLYKQIRVGRGHYFHDYLDDSIFNKVVGTEPDDYDSYGTGWAEDKSKEFSFCCPECLMQFLSKLYQDTYFASLEMIKTEKKETLDISYEEFKKKHGAVIPFFKKIQTSFSKKVFQEDAIAEADKLIARLKRIKKDIIGDSLQ